MANDPMRSKAAAVFGKEFMNVVKGNDPKGMQVNSAQVLQKRANARPIPVYKDGGQVSSRVATRAAMAGYKEGGDASKRERINRKIADIESDYQKALKSGKNEGVAKAKYEQRMADAEDDYAKWTGADRSQTSAAEKAAEASLSEARRTKGQSIRDRDMKAKPRAAIDNVEKAMSDVRSGIGEIKTPEAKLVKPAAAAPARPKVAAPPRPAVVKTEAPAAPARSAAAALPRMSADMGQARAVRPAAAAAAPAAAPDYNSPEARRARLAKVLGIGGSRPDQQAINRQGTMAANVAEQIGAASAARDKAQANAARVAKLRAAGNERDARFYEQNPDALKKGGKPGKYAAGGAGKVRKGVMKGK